MLGRAASLVLVALAVLTALGVLPADAADLRLGYQLGAAESAGSTLTSSQDLATPDMTVSTRVVRLSGLNLTTNAAANLSLDLATPELHHAFLGGLLFGQISPVGSGGQAGITTIQGTAQYLARTEQPTWGAAFAAGYGLGSNGRLGIGSDGSIQGGGTGQTNPGGTQFGAFVVNGVSHTVNARSQLQLTREFWDASFLCAYVFTNNGTFSLAPIVPGAPAAASQIGSANNLGAFVRATTHQLTPTLTYRARPTTSGNFSATAQSIFTAPVVGSDLSVGTGTAAATLPSTAIFPRSLNTNGSVSYVYNDTADRAFGVRAQTFFNMRVPTSAITQLPASGGGLKSDALVYGARLTYSDLLPFRLRVNAELGAAQSWLFQPPFGVIIPFNERFNTIHEGWTPVFSLTAQRFLEPILATVGVLRDLAVGPFGASVLVNESASLTLQYQLRTDLPASVLVGFNLNQRRAVARELFANASSTFALASNNRGFGANVLAAKRFYEEGDLSIDGIASYNFNWLDPDPDQVQMNTDGTIGRPPIWTHVALFTIRGMFGRGPLTAPISGQAAGPFATGADGLPLTSSRLLNPNAPLLDNARGSRPGAPPDEERDSIEAYERSRSRTEAGQASKQKNDAVRGNMTIEEEEKAAEEKEAEEREERRKKRVHKFEEWPMDAKPLEKTPEK